MSYREPVKQPGVISALQAPRGPDGSPAAAAAAALRLAVADRGANHEDRDRAAGQRPGSLQGADRAAQSKLALPRRCTFDSA